MLRSDVQGTLKLLNGMISRNRGTGWINWLLKVSIVLRGGKSAAVARASVVCIRFFYKLVRVSGRRGLVLYTKNATVILMQAVSGNPCTNTWALGSGVGRDRSGIPKVIPRVHRDLIRRGDVFTIRLWMSWFSIYRVLSFPSKLKLNTITDAGKNFDLTEFEQPIQDFVSQVLGGKIKKIDFSLVSLSKATPSITAGKNRVSWSPLGILLGALGIMTSEVYSHFFAVLNTLVKLSPSDSLIHQFYDAVKEWTNALSIPQSKIPKGDNWVPLPWRWFPLNPIGKLGFKVEAAGKVRVFAMVDCWTQWVLNPLHQALFTSISWFPSDGTFDQLKPVQTLIKAGFTRFWCYDLSAATDRLPVSLQARILDFLVEEGFGTSWAKLLVDRDYYLPHGLPKGCVYEGDLPESIRYKVGQPMGALSSWAMLALTHHFIVHLAAHRVGKEWGTFWDYAVLGDDIVIANGAVAGQYLYLMERLGVGIGLHKSLVSRKGILEFAKRFYVRGKDASPVPFKEQVAALCDFESSTEFIRKYGLGARSIAAFLGYGYRVRGRLCGHFNTLPKKLATVAIWRCSPWGSVPHNFESWFNITSWVIQPKWLKQIGEMWPELTLHQSKCFEKFVSLDAKRLKRCQDQMPERDTYGGNKELMEYMENTLWKIAQEFDSHLPWRVIRTQYFAPKFYKVLFGLQQLYWEKSNPLLERDIGKMSDTLFKFKTSVGGNQPDWKILEWIKTRQDTTVIHGPRKLGEVIKIKGSPSILFPTRLWSSVMAGTKDQVKVGIRSKRKSTKKSNTKKAK